MIQFNPEQSTDFILVEGDTSGINKKLKDLFPTDSQSLKIARDSLNKAIRDLSNNK